MRRLVHVGMLLLPLSAAAGDLDRTANEPNALLVNVTEADLNRIVVGSFRSNGGPFFEGMKRRVSSSLADLTYQARLSDPVVRLGEDGRAWLTLDVREANLRIGRLERKIGAWWASCEDAGIDVNPGRPLEVTLDVDFRIENGDLRIVPASVKVRDATGRLSLVKPSRCTSALMPRWLLWWLGKPYLRRYLGNLDEILLERARKSAAKIDEKPDFLRKSWEIPGGESGGAAELRLVPAALDTSGRSLLVSLTGSSGATGPGGAPRPIAWRGPRSDRSFLAVSETFTNEAARLTVSRMSGERRRPTGNLRRLLRSSSIYALVPGLRGLLATDTVLYSVAFRSPPRIDFRRIPETGLAGLPAPTGDGASPALSRAMVGLLLSDIELRLWRADGQGETTLLGTLEVNSGRLGVVPFMSLLGGISFRVVENEWLVSSKGVLFNDALISATLQELTFGRFFATGYEPLGKDAFHVGGAEFVPRAFDVIDDYLVIELGAPESEQKRGLAARAPTRTDTLLGSR